MPSATPAGAIAPPCEKDFKAECFAVESLDASLSTTQAGAHPDLTFSFEIAQDPESALDKKGLHDGFAPTRNVRTDVPPGLIGDPNVLGAPQQCRVIELTLDGCPNGSQIGLVKANLYKANKVFLVPVYMMVPPGGDVIARVAIPPVPGATFFADATLRSESDYGLSVEILDAPNLLTLIDAETTLWGVPAAEEHDTERCTPQEIFDKNCTESPPRPPGSRELPFTTNPTRCGVPLEMSVSASSWVEPERFDTKTHELPADHRLQQTALRPGVDDRADQQARRRPDRPRHNRARTRFTGSQRARTLPDPRCPGPLARGHGGQHQRRRRSRGLLRRRCQFRRTGGLRMS